MQNGSKCTSIYPSIASSWIVMCPCLRSCISFRIKKPWMSSKDPNDDLVRRVHKVSLHSPSFSCLVQPCRSLASPDSQTKPRPVCFPTVLSTCVASALYSPTRAPLYSPLAPAESMPVWTNGGGPRSTPSISLGDVYMLGSSCCHPLHLL